MHEQPDYRSGERETHIRLDAERIVYGIALVLTRMIGAWFVVSSILSLFSAAWTATSLAGASEAARQHIMRSPISGISMQAVISCAFGALVYSYARTIARLLCEGLHGD